MLALIVLITLSVVITVFWPWISGKSQDNSDYDEAGTEALIKRAHAEQEMRDIELDLSTGKITQEEYSSLHSGLNNRT